MTPANENSLAEVEPWSPLPVVVTVGALLISMAVFLFSPLDEASPPSWTKSVSSSASGKGASPAKPVATIPDPLVDIETTLGTIRVKLYAEKAPRTTENFLDLVRGHFYDGVVFHRVIKDFMIQTGDPKGTGTGGRADRGLPPKFLEDEFHPDLRHSRAGILSMANSGPNTGDTQFFITTRATPHLDDRHAIFGEVVSGMEVVRKIEDTPTQPGDRPIDPPRIIRATLVEAAPGGASKPSS